MTPSGKLRFKDYLKAFNEYYSEELLTLLQCDMKLSGPLDSTWLARLTHLDQPNSQKAVHHPLHHILAIRFLHTTVERFFLNNFIAPTPFGHAPWPCLNPVCEYYRQKNILTYQVAEAKTKGRVVGIFTCSCGFTYSRIGPDVSPTMYIERARSVHMVLYGKPS
jgi:Tn7-like transposition protein D